MNVPYRHKMAAIAIAASLIVGSGRALAVEANGLEIVPASGLTLLVKPGQCTVDGRPVKVAATATLRFEPAKIEQVRNEKHRLVAEKPRGWAVGTRLQGCVSRRTTLPGCLVPGSVVVKDSPDGKPYVLGKDYLVDDAWGMLGRIEGGRIGARTDVYVDYRYSLMRLDAVQVSPEGVVSIRSGEDAKTCPHPPQAQEGSMAIANILLDYNSQELKSTDIFPVGPPLPAPTPDALRQKAQRVAKTRAKLEQGQRLLIGFWGDSVTCGGDASSPEKRFADGFVARLREKYPKAQIDFFNAGIGGSNTNQRLPNLDQDVLQKRPDLVVIEYVNDMGFTPETMRKHYYQAIDQIRAIGAEVILITPHFTMPRSMGFEDVWSQDQRAACQALREIAEEKQVGLADAARVWQHLCKQGIPYTTLLYNGINHPDDRGHKIFIEELMKSF